MNISSGPINEPKTPKAPAHSSCLPTPSLKLTQSSNSVSTSTSSTMKFHATTNLALLLFLLLLLLSSSSLQVSMAGSEFCDGKCKVRCSKASRHDDCLKYCGICCASCNCVPSGTAGNKDECPCYRDMTTGEGKRKRPKCP